MLQPHFGVRYWFWLNMAAGEAVGRNYWLIRGRWEQHSFKFPITINGCSNFEKFVLLISGGCKGNGSREAFFVTTLHCCYNSGRVIVNCFLISRVSNQWLVLCNFVWIIHIVQCILLHNLHLLSKYFNEISW